MPFGSQELAAAYGAVLHGQAHYRALSDEGCAKTATLRNTLICSLQVTPKLKGTPIGDPVGQKRMDGI
jgi:hypothetical protein